MLVVADFDNYFYSVRDHDNVSNMITDPTHAKVFTWETTTSYDALAEISQNELAPECVLVQKEMGQRP